MISPLDWVVFTVDQGMAAMPWARRMIETIESFMLKRGLKVLGSIDCSCGCDCDEDDGSRESVDWHLDFIDLSRSTRNSDRD